MTLDATTLLIQAIQNGFSQTGATNRANTGVLGAADSTVGTAANYAQLLGTAIAPLAQAAAVQAVGSAAAATADAAGQAAFLTAGIETAGIGAGVVLIVSTVLGLIFGSGQPGSADSQQYSELLNAIEDVARDFLNGYWQTTKLPIGDAWGNLGVDLDNIARQGTGGSNVKNYNGSFHDDAAKFVQLFFTNPIASDFWTRPFFESDPAEPFDGVYFPRWYGSLPEPPGASAGVVPDPRTMLPFVALGLQSYMKIQMLVYFIHPATEQPFDQFLSQYGPDFIGYLQFLYGGADQYPDSNPECYSLAVNGILKTDLPSQADVIGGLYSLVNTIQPNPIAIDTDPDNKVPYWGGSPPPPGLGEAGYAWSGEYGAAETYPVYGVYPPISVNSVGGASSCSASCFVSYAFSESNALNMMAQFRASGVIFDLGSSTYISSDKLGSWVVPWLQNRIILGNMARWKAIYLINAYDSIWSILQRVEVLVKPDPAILPPIMTLNQDGMMASGDWSARELCKVLKADGDLLDGVAIDSPADGFLIYVDGKGSYSVFALTQFLDNIANGNWGGPPGYSVSGNGPARPLGLRDRLAAAAV